MEATSQLARGTARYLCGDFLADHSLAELAKTLGVSDRHMRQVFQDEFGVAPVEFWQTQRLLLAKRLLTDSRMSITEVALASGFKSLRRFNTLLKSRYRLTPTELRRPQKQGLPRQFDNVIFRLSYRPPYDWGRLLDFLAARAIPGVEAVHDGIYARTVRVRRKQEDILGFIQVGHAPDGNAISVRLSESLLPVCATVLERVGRLFDLDADPAMISAALGDLSAGRPGLRVPGSVDGFELAVRAVLGQQITVAGAQTVAGRLAATFGTPVATGVEGLSQVFPAAERIASASVEQLGKLGLTKQRVQTLLALARAVANGELLLEPGHPVEATLERLQRLPGIGEWTAQYIAMRALAWPDAFPRGDLALAKAVGERRPKKILELAEKWRPWRAYAALHLWASLAKKL
jgi:AraC family transcriptional regulator of adaptative response / DNA-3-methyladenine glycosylase II